MKQPLLQGTGVCKAFPGGGGTAEILHSVDVTVYEGEFTAIMGASGAGKSTLLYVLSGMDSATGGSVAYRGREITGLSEGEMAALRSREFGFVFQQAHLVSSLTLFENVAVAGFIGKKHDAGTVQKKADQLLRRMGVEKAGDRMPAQASGGEAQRAAIARAMINDPGLLFADEPTGALNKSGGGEVLDLLTALNQRGQSILMVTHDLRAAVRSGRILYLEDGRLLDELALPPYEESQAREREETVSGWLSALRW